MKHREHAEAVKVMKWAQANSKRMPEVDMLFAIPNGGARSKRTGAMLKAEGVKSGVPDYFLPVARGRFHGLFIELKAKGGKPSKNQKAWITVLKGYDYAAGVCYGADEAIKILEAYLRD